MPTNNIKDIDYLFLTAMLRAREAKMLTRDKMERMLDIPDFDESVKFLLDCGYADMSGMDADQIENALEEHRAAIFEEIDLISPERDLVSAFRVKYDYHNVKVIIKAEGADVDGAHLLSRSGRVPLQVLIDAYNNEDYRFIPSPMAHALTEAKGILARTGNPQLSDFTVDKTYYSELSHISSKLCGTFLTEYTRILIDSANLRATIRTLRLGRDLDFLKTALIAGGNVGAERLASTAISGDGVASAFLSTPFESAAQYGVAAASGGSLTAFELECDNAVTKYLGKAKLVGFGDDPVIAYLSAVEIEITAVRMILTGKRAGINPDIIRERLRASYV